ncbi:hypothetical protein MCOR04_006875 [Pyricularia oryzae]|uniref:C2H2-type domain-containing protein n=1 Tax=Pyricularia oryzae TaxID=318829 RepID=A0A4P7NV18_PYROR|nr:hypothetical protein MCOR04_006875 [Pyricularia oryzae]QBZ66330.1 hypothetical protein PoMZ_13304 [Pyricularia oryzae]
MQIFNIVQVLGLLAIGASALPTPANVGAVQPVEGSQLQARSGRFYSSGWTQSPSANSGYPSSSTSTQYKCNHCGKHTDTESQQQTHQEIRHPGKTESYNKVEA